MRQNTIFDSMNPETNLSQQVARSCDLLRKEWQNEKRKNGGTLQHRKKLDLIVDIGNYLTPRYIEGLIRELGIEIGTHGEDVRALLEILEKLNRRGFISNATPSRLEEIKEGIITVWQGLLERKEQ